MVIIQIIKTFLFNSSVYSCHLFLISSASVKVFAVSALYTAHTCMKYSLDISSFLEEISSLSHSIVFLYFFALFIKKAFFYLSLLFSGTLYSVEYIFPLSSASILSSATCKASSDNHFALLHLFFFGMVLVTASCTMLWTSIHSSSDTLSTRYNVLNLLVSFPVSL